MVLKFLKFFSGHCFHLRPLFCFLVKIKIEFFHFFHRDIFFDCFSVDFFNTKKSTEKQSKKISRGKKWKNSILIFTKKQKSGRRWKQWPEKNLRNFKTMKNSITDSGNYFTG